MTLVIGGNETSDRFRVALHPDLLDVAIDQRLVLCCGHATPPRRRRSLALNLPLARRWGVEN
jgi:hypothetical protein